MDLDSQTPSHQEAIQAPIPSPHTKHAIRIAIFAASLLIILGILLISLVIYHVHKPRIAEVVNKNAIS